MKILICEYEYEEYVSFVCKSVEALAKNYIECNFCSSDREHKSTKEEIYKKIISNVSLDVEEGIEQFVSFEDDSPFIRVIICDTEKLE